MPAIDPNLIIQAIQTLTSELPNHAKKIYAKIIVFKTWLSWKTEENATTQGRQVTEEQQKQHKEMENKLAALYSTLHGEAELDYDSILTLLNDNPTMKNTIKELFDLNNAMMGRTNENFVPQTPDYVFFIFSLMTSENYPEMTNANQSEEMVRKIITDYTTPHNDSSGGTKKKRNQKSKKSKKSSKRKTRR